MITLRNDYIFSFLWWVVFLNKLGGLRTWTLHVTRRSAFFELSHPRTHIFHVHNAITACLTQLSMNFDWFHVTQLEESDNHALFFECKRRHFSTKNTTATRPRHTHSTGSTVLPLGLAQPKEQPRLLQQLSCFYLLPFPEKKIRIPYNLNAPRIFAKNSVRILSRFLLLNCLLNNGLILWIRLQTRSSSLLTFATRCLSLTARWHSPDAVH